MDDKKSQSGTNEHFERIWKLGRIRFFPVDYNGSAERIKLESHFSIQSLKRKLQKPRKKPEMGVLKLLEFLSDFSDMKIFSIISKFWETTTFF